MQNNISIFKHELFGDTRFIQDGDSFVVVAKDVVERVGNAWNGLRSVQHVPECWRGVESVSTPSGTQEVITLTEQGLYFYLGRCDKPLALQYQMWIAGEVVPAIRKHGAYIPVKEGDTPDVVMARGILAAQGIVAELKAKIAADAPDVQLATDFLKEGNNIDINAFSKTLQGVGVHITPNKLFELLRVKKVLCSKTGIHKNRPFQEFVQKGWLTVKPIPACKQDEWGVTPLVTPLGVKELSKRIPAWLDEIKKVLAT